MVSFYVGARPDKFRRIDTTYDDSIRLRIDISTMQLVRTYQLVLPRLKHTAGHCAGLEYTELTFPCCAIHTVHADPCLRKIDHIP